MLIHGTKVPQEEHGSLLDHASSGRRPLDLLPIATGGGDNIKQMMSLPCCVLLSQSSKVEELSKSDLKQQQQNCGMLSIAVGGKKSEYLVQHGTTTED